MFVVLLHVVRIRVVGLCLMAGRVVELLEARPRRPLQKRRSALIEVFLSFHVRQKAPPERMTFPTLSHSASPYQSLPAYLLVLGKKIDNAEKIKDTPICVEENRIARTSWTPRAQGASGPRSLALSPCRDFELVRFSGRIEKPLSQLKSYNTTLIDCQCQTMATVPDEWGFLRLLFLPFQVEEGRAPQAFRGCLQA